MDVSGLKIERGPARSTRRTAARGASPWFARAVVLAVLGGAVWLFWAPLARVIDLVRLPQVQVLQVVASHPAAAGAARGTAANGHIVAARRAALSADTPGRIVELRVTEGSLVKRGEVVARLYDEEYAAALRRADAELASAKVGVERAAAALAQAEAELTQFEKTAEAAADAVTEAQANLEFAELEFARIEGLRAQGFRAETDLDSARNNLDASRAQRRAAAARQRAADAAVAFAQARIATAAVDCDAARSRVGELAAARDLAEATLKKTEVKAPFDGIVVLKDAEVGEVVSPNSQGGSNARGSVCTMVDLASLEAQAEVPETSLSAVRTGAPATVYLDAFPDIAYQGRVDRIWPTANRQKASVEVRVKLDQPDERLRPEMGVRVVFLDQEPDPQSAEPSEAAILVPQDAVVKLDGADGVFTLERDVVEFRPVQLGDRRGNRVAVRNGLQPGERVVLAPPNDLQSGDRVRIAQS